MLKLRYAVVVILSCLSSAAFAQTPTADPPRGACKADYEKFCAGTAPGGGRVVACLNKQHAQLSTTCKSALDSRKKK